VEEWEDKITFNPIRGEPEPDNADRDNNALFYGTGGTGKTSLARRITYNIENVLEDDYSLERESQR
jgi:Cdc6-like AAA superfamily ATPase